MRDRRLEGSGGARRATGMARPLGALLAALLGVLGSCPPAQAQVELRVEERERDLSGVEIAEAPLARHLLPAQELAVWLPEGFEALPAQGSGSTGFRRAQDGATVLFTRTETQPGASLIQTMEAVLAELRERDALEEVASIRRLRLASRHAIEVTAIARVQGRPAPLRVVLAMDPDDRHLRSILVQKAGEAGEPVDALFSRLLRDWSPLDASVWSPAFERLRSALVTDAPSVLWARRNRLLDEIAQPQAIGDPRVHERLADLAGGDPALLLDGVLHPHPRVRIASLAAIDPDRVAEPERSHLFALVMQDPDPAVRYRGALRVAASPELAAEALDRLLEVDAEVARSAAFQLLAAVPPPRRAELLAATFARRRQYPEASRVLLAVLLARWGSPGQAQEALYQAWRTSREERLREVALQALLAGGRPEALVAARERLLYPLQPAPLELPAAARALALHARVDERRSLEVVAGLLQQVAESTPDAEVEAELAAALAVIRQLLDHFESLPEGASLKDECALLEARPPGEDWVVERMEVEACPTAVTRRRPVHISLPRPGAFAASLLDLLERISLASPPHNEVLHAGLDRLFEALRHWAGDPVSMTSTGVDLSAPLELTWWPAASRSKPADLFSDRTAFILRARSGDFQRVLDAVLRLSAGSVDLAKLTTGLLVVHTVPLLPTVLVGLWEEERAVVVGEGSGSSTPKPPERYVALTDGSQPAGGEQATLFELELDKEGGAQWTLTQLSRHEDLLTVTRGELPDSGAEEPPPRDPTATDHASYLEVELPGLPEGFGDGAGDASTSGPVPAGARLRARSEVALPLVTTRVELSGLPGGWTSAVVNGPASALRAPSELLPRSCLTWLGLRFDPAALERLLEEHRAALDEALGERRSAKLIAATGLLQGEAGLALIGVPEPGSGSAAKAWARHLVLFISAEPRAADRFLKRASRRRETLQGLRYYRWQDLVAARFGRFVAVASNAEVLARLAEGPRFASSPTYEGILALAGGDAAVFAGFDTDLVADVLGESLAARRDEGPSALAIEALRALGDIAAWVRREESSLVAEVSIAPRLHSQDEQERRRRLSGYSGFVKGSIGADGLPAEAAIDPPYAAIELSLRLPPGSPQPALAWPHERLGRRRLDSGEERLVSRRAEPLPETSPIELPITSPELLPYLRNEPDLDLHLDEVRALGEEIRGAETDPARIVRAIVAWAHESLEYSVIPRATSVEEILATRRADCTEFTQLTISLARSVGIPARPVTGVHLGRDAAILHSWVEVYLDRWYEVDPTSGVVRVPATNVRIPTGDALYLASLPGSRFTVHAALGAEGGWTRRLPAGEPGARSGTLALAVDRGRVLVDVPVPGDDGLAAGRTLLSEDGGRSFAELSTAALNGELVATLGGHGRLLRLHREAGDGSRGEPVLYELVQGGEWERLRWPDGIPGPSGALSLGVAREGYLALAGAGSEARLFLIDPAFGQARPLALPPPPGGEWLLAPYGGALAHTVPGSGVSVHLRRDAGWAPPVSLEGSGELVAREIRAAGDRIEVVVEQPPDGEPVLYRLDGSSQSRRSDTVRPSGLAATATDDDGAQWTLWADATGRYLTRRPPDPR